MKEFIWFLIKDKLLEGVDDNKKENMREVFDLIKTRSHIDDLNISLVIVRRIYPTLSEISEPKEFVDRFLKKLNVGSANFVKNNLHIFYAGLQETFCFRTYYNTFDNILKDTNNIDIEAELMAAMAATITKEFEEEG